MLTSWAAPSHATVGRHGHEEAHFVLVTGGRYRSDVTTRSEPSCGQLMFNPAGTEHDDRFEGGGSFFAIALSAQLQFADFDARLLKEPVALERTSVTMLAFRLLRELNNWGPDSMAVAHGLALELVSALEQPVVGHDGAGWLGRVRDLIEDGLEGPLDLDRLSAEAGVHPVHVTRAFRRRYGATPGEYQRIQRLRRAAHFLVARDDPVVEVALSSGFADQAHLTRRFAQAYGLTPAMYRRLVHGRR